MVIASPKVWTRSRALSGTIGLARKVCWHEIHADN